MDWIAIITLIIPLIKDCINGGASDDSIRRRIKNPNQRQIRGMRRKVNRKVRHEEPEMRRKYRKVRVDTLLDDMLARGRDATDEQIDEIIAKARG